LAFLFLFFIFFNWPHVKKTFPHQILFLKNLKINLKKYKNIQIIFKKILKSKKKSEKYSYFFPKNLKIEIK